MLTKPQLEKYRHLAEQYPEGNIADLISHIDTLGSEMEKIYESLVAIHRAIIVFNRYTASPIQNSVFEVIVKIKELLQHEGYTE